MVVAGVVVGVVAAGVGWSWWQTDTSPQVRLEPVAVAVDDAFTPTVAVNEQSLTAPDGLLTPELIGQRLPARDHSAPAGPLDLGSTTQIAGTTPGLFGGTRDQHACNPDQLVAFLATDPDKARAWAAVHGLGPADIGPFVDGLTPLVLTRDTLVTNHGYRNDQTYPIQAVLEAGTAILVDDRGLPTVKCSCGNPLLPPATLPSDTQPRVSGQPWNGWHPDHVTIITVDTRTDTFVLTDLHGGPPFHRPVGSTPDHDHDLPHDHLCHHLPTHPDCALPETTGTDHGTSEAGPEAEDGPDVGAAISAGNFHTCGLQADGTPICWGWNHFGESSPPAGLELTAISAGDHHACGLESGGTPVCWGSDLHGESLPPAGLTLTAISTGGAHSCGLEADGTPACWGYDGYGESSPTAGLELMAISTYYQHTCGLEVDGTPVCWGLDDFGESSPPAGLELSAISAGGYHTCGLAADGTPICWGLNDVGQSSPPAGLELTAISAGFGYTCGLDASGTPVCWGWDDDGQSSPPAGLTFTAISAGHAHTCGLEADGAPVCWGRDLYGEASPPDGVRLGPPADPEPAPDPQPDPPVPDSGDGPLAIVGEATIIGVGTDWLGHTCGLEADGTPICWGGGTMATLLDDPWGHDTHPKALPPDGLTLTAISAGRDHTCGLTADGVPMCWGSNDRGQSSPPAGTSLTTISAGWAHTCGLQADGTPTCWGSDDAGRSSPPEGLTLATISAGGSHTCGLQADGSPICWGLSSPPELTLTAVSAGESHTCGLRADGSPICWGTLGWGEASPPDGLTLVAIAAGSHHTCGLEANGTPVCWGHDGVGQATPPDAVWLVPRTGG